MNRMNQIRARAAWQLVSEFKKMSIRINKWRRLLRFLEFSGTFPALFRHKLQVFLDEKSSFFIENNLY